MASDNDAPGAFRFPIEVQSSETNSLALLGVRVYQKVQNSTKKIAWVSVPSLILLVSVQVISLAHETYAQDLVSLGYGWLDASSASARLAERLAPEAGSDQEE